MKKVIYLFIGIAIILILYNLTFLDFSNLFEGESSIALIGVFSGACVILLMLILHTSRKIARKKR